MSGFIDKAACRHRRPAHLGQPSSTLRPDLVARLLRERRSPRFIFAPGGYGKTALAAEYCETVFFFDHVFWIRATSPCFIRDLDADAIASAVEQADDEAALIVFDDVPSLDAERAGLLAEQVRRLLDRGCEIIVIGDPLADHYGDAFPERLVIAAEDLLLDDRELEALGSRFDLDDKDASAFPASARVPALAWGQGDERLRDFLAATLADSVPLPLAQAMAYMLITGAGSMDDALGEYARACDLMAEGGDGASFMPADRIAGILAWGWPHLGIDEGRATFDCAGFAMDGVARALKGWAKRAAAAYSADVRDGLVYAWTERLCTRDSRAMERAADAARLLLSGDVRMRWTFEQGAGMLDAGSYYACKVLISSLGSVDQPYRARLNALEAACAQRLGDEACLQTQVRRLAFGQDIPHAEHLIGLSLAVHAGLQPQAGKALALLAQEADERDRRSQDAATDLATDAADAAWASWEAFADALAGGALALAQGRNSLVGYFEDALSAGVAAVDADSLRALCVLAAWLLDSLAADMRSGMEAACVEPVPHIVESFVRSRLADVDMRPPDAFEAAAGLAMERAHAAGIVFSQGPLPAAAMMMLRQVELSVLSQRMRYESDQRRKRKMKADRAKMYPDLAVSSDRAAQLLSASRRVPLLTVRMFGKLDMRIGDSRIGEGSFRRQKVRRLFLILVINQGREISRDAACEHLWPTSPIDVSRRNFYTIFSELKHALMLPDGTCPYLIRHRLGCALDDSNVQTDIARLDEICREFLFGEPDELGWGELFREIDRDFRDDLLPSETTDDYIVQARRDLRHRLVDALTVGAQRITQCGSPQRGIWFARAAIAHDRTREDAHMALMGAQVAANQRTAAIMTYLNMRRILADELGIDPSAEAQELYARILGGDDVTATIAC